MITESQGPKTSTIVIAAVLAGIAAMALGLWFARPPAEPSWNSAIFYPEPRPVEAFDLIDANGARLAPDAFSGSWDLVFFGFTNCPDVCPNTLSVLRDMNEVLAAQGLAPARVTLVSVDPERDRPAVMKDYVAFFDPAFRAVTGDDEALRAFSLALGAAYFVEDHEPGALDYAVDHSAAVMVVDPAGRLLGQLRPPAEAEAFAADLARLMAG